MSAKSGGMDHFPRRRVAVARPSQWEALERYLEHAPPSAAFDPSSCERFDEPVRRFLLAAIADRTELVPGARLQMRGSIRLGRWLPFRADQLLAPRAGTVWSACVGGVISGSDHYVNGEGGMDWRVFGRWRVMSATGADVARSAAGRVAGESVWVPTALVGEGGPTLRALDEDRVGVRLVVGDEAIDVTHRIAEDGRVLASSLLRWGDPDRTGTWGLHPFGLEVTGWRTFDGVTIPHQGRAGWFFGTPRWRAGEFFRFSIDRYEAISSRASVLPMSDSASEWRTS